MNCPVCRAAMGPAQFHGVRFPRCFACKSNWLVGPMLKTCADAIVKEGKIPDAEIGIGKKIEGTAAVAEPHLPCPACMRPMDKLNYGYNSNVIVDHCSPCDGTWVDDGKLRSIAIYVKGNPALDRLGAAFLEEGSRLKEEGDQARFLFSMINPLSWAFNIPYKTTVPITRRPVVLYSLMAANAFVYFFLEPRSYLWRAFFRRWGLVPTLVAHGFNYHGFLSSMFLHAGLLHLLGNMYFVWLFGRNVESALDHAEFLLLYLVGGFASGLMQVGLNMSSAIPLVGASGAISTVLGAFMRLYPDSKVEIWVGRGRVRIFSARFYLGAWFAFQAFSLLKNAAFGTFSGVAFAAHIGGFLAGYALTPVPGAGALADAAAAP